MTIKQYINRLRSLSVHIRPLMILLYGMYSPTEILFFEKQKLAYVALSKVANSSIRKSLVSLLDAQVGEVQDDYSIHNAPWQKKYRYGNSLKDYYKFSIVRNPFDRLVSTYTGKLKSDVKKGLGYHLKRYLFGYIKHTDTFEEFVDKICKIPDWLSDTHFKSQYASLYKNNTLMVDYVGKFEHIGEDFGTIVKKYDLEPLPHYNKSSTKKKSWKDFYTKETLEKVYQRYKNDVISFGYEEEYKTLKEQLG